MAGPVPPARTKSRYYATPASTWNHRRRTCGSTGNADVITQVRRTSGLPGDRTTAPFREARLGRTARPEQGRPRGAPVPRDTLGAPRACCSPQSCSRAARPGRLWTAGTGNRRLAQERRPKSCAAPNGSGSASRRSRNTMRVKPYAIRSPSRNARHTVLRAPGGSISTSGCSCRYRSSLRTWSGGPGGTSCTGQYRYPLSGPRNRLLKTRATRRRGYGYPPPRWTLRRPSQTSVSPPHAEPPPGSTPKWLTCCRYRRASNSLTPER